MLQLWREAFLHSSMSINKEGIKINSLLLELSNDIYLTRVLVLWSCLPLRLYLFVCLSVFLYVCVSVCVSVCLSVFVSFFLPVCPSVCLSFYLSASLLVCLSACLSVFLSVCLSVYLSFCLSVGLSLPCIPRLTLFVFTNQREGQLSVTPNPFQLFWINTWHKHWP